MEEEGLGTKRDQARSALDPDESSVSNLWDVINDGNKGGWGGQDCHAK